MNETIIRGIDDLGRIAIPKDFRFALAIQEGDALEIHLVDGGVFIEKHQPVEQKGD